ncbi:flagellar protein export ATPase FliI [Benzoatithermus flavus]|uniref:Flagellum-specific ATP synthase n=1 Tax=Benzoatithermus flavus TaxID=3108223 RepID=A0ABU8XUY3_9PROT
MTRKESPSSFAQARAALEDIEPMERWGEVAGALGLLIEVAGLPRQAVVGDAVRIGTAHRPVLGEIVGFRRASALVMPFGSTEGIGPGARVETAGRTVVRPSEGWLGRVVDALGRPIDGHGPLPQGPIRQPTRGDGPNAYARRRVGRKLATGIKALDVFAPLCRGQRLGIFAGSGVGKSTLMAMLARWADADVIVIGLVGERGREVQEFVQHELGPEGMARSVIVVATSNEPPLMRREAAYTTLAVAEWFRDRGRHVLLLMDSVTRFAMAQREIGLAAGEPPTTKGYVPSCFSEMARLLERAGPGETARDQGDITAIFTVLVDGGDHDEPVADAVRGILDGHVVLERAIAERGRYPAVNVLKSISRTLPHCHDAEENRLLTEARRVLARYEEMGDLVRIGAYKRGGDPATDRAIALGPQLDAFIGQPRDGREAPQAAFAELARILGHEAPRRQDG